MEGGRKEGTLCVRVSNAGCSLIRVVQKVHHIVLLVCLHSRPLAAALCVLRARLALALACRRSRKRWLVGWRREGCSGGGHTSDGPHRASKLATAEPWPAHLALPPLWPRPLRHQTTADPARRLRPPAAPPPPPGPPRVRPPRAAARAARALAPRPARWAARPAAGTPEGAPPRSGPPAVFGGVSRRRSDEEIGSAAPAVKGAGRCRRAALLRAVPPQAQPASPGGLAPAAPESAAPGPTPRGWSRPAGRRPAGRTARAAAACRTAQPGGAAPVGGSGRAWGQSSSGQQWPGMPGTHAGRAGEGVLTEVAPRPLPSRCVGRPGTAECRPTHPEPTHPSTHPTRPHLILLQVRALLVEKGAAGQGGRHQRQPTLEHLRRRPAGG